MKRTIILCMLALPVVSTAETNTCQQLILQLQGVTEVAGSAVGFAGTPGRFYSLSRDFLAQGSEPDFHRMLNSTNPVVRLMGLYCIANTHTNVSTLWLPASMFIDATKVSYAPGGCSVMRVGVSDIARDFIRDPECLGPSHKKRSRLQPTAAASPIVDRQNVDGQ